MKRSDCCNKFNVIYEEWYLNIQRWQINAYFLSNFSVKKKKKKNPEKFIKVFSITFDYCKNDPQNFIWPVAYWTSLVRFLLGKTSAALRYWFKFNPHEKIRYDKAPKQIAV